MPNVNTIIYVGIALTVMFLLLAVLVLPQFSRSYRYCQDLQWNPDNSSDYAECPNRYWDAQNTSVVSTSPYSQTTDDETISAPVPDLAGTLFCINCETEGGYRSANQGLVLLIIVMGLIGFAIRFIKFK